MRGDDLLDCLSEAQEETMETFQGSFTEGRAYPPTREALSSCDPDIRRFQEMQNDLPAHLSFLLLNACVLFLLIQAFGNFGPSKLD